MMKQKIILSLSLVLIISFGFGFIFSSILGFWQGVVGALILQFFISYGVSIYMENRRQKLNNFDEIQAIIEAQTVPVTCPCNNNTFFAPITITGDNLFTCEKCNSRFRVDVVYESVLQTEPVNLQNAYEILTKKGTPV